MKHLFIVNPVAGKGKALEYIPEIKRIFAKRKNDIYFIETTEKPGHAIELVKSYVKRDTYRIYSIGGDGTLNEVLNGMAESDSSLAIVPAGSGNDFVKSLESYSTFDTTKSSLLNSLIDGMETITDIGKINDRFFINISSIGFDANVVYNAAKFKKIPFVNGLLAYTMGVLLTLVS
ncbi:MAG: diacylglycerol kinase family lipid kinase, partial [Clostridiaceae bacterium]|nr:diacylglycerol kinase family lipid kinase [Clostridiaceae bacterium]